MGSYSLFGPWNWIEIFWGLLLIGLAELWIYILTAAVLVLFAVMVVRYGRRL